MAYSSYQMRKKKKKKLQAQKNVYFPKTSLKYLLDNEHYIVNATK